MAQATRPDEPEPPASPPAQVPPPRPTPDPGQTPTPRLSRRLRARQALHRTNWERLATITAAAAAAIGLVFSAWTTYISQEVARDQLAHSKDQDEESQRSQAASANAWVEQRWKSGVAALVISNRSFEPLKDVVVGMIVFGYVGEEQKPLRVATISIADSIPPCSKVELHLKDVYATDEKVNTLLEHAKVDDYFISFRDANAREWERDKYGSLRQASRNADNSTREEYVSLGETLEYDGPHQAKLDEELNSYKALDCGDR